MTTLLQASLTAVLTSSSNSGSTVKSSPTPPSMPRTSVRFSARLTRSRLTVGASSPLICTLGRLSHLAPKLIAEVARNFDALLRVEIGHGHRLVPESDLQDRSTNRRSGACSSDRRA